MITKQDKEHIKQVVGFRYVKAIQKHLNDKGCFSQNGKQYSSSMITNVMNGANHAIIEQAIYEVVAMKKEEIKKRKQILEG
ncbi:hypothetical protein [Tenacibaculum dicentrarchi]|uniref:hypothetical protein n=1 Tax=Tenacibaculum dicentrarchi TaxID=669041 RepID=UPI00351763A6